MNKHHIAVRKDAIKAATAGPRLGEGRVHQEGQGEYLAHGDGLHRGCSAGGGTQPEPPYAVTNRAMAYLCAVIPRGPSDPGSYHDRFNRISKWNWCQYVTQDTVIRAFVAAVEFGIADVRKIRQEQDSKEIKA